MDEYLEVWGVLKNVFCKLVMLVIGIVMFIGIVGVLIFVGIMVV